jgi:hypothetical protein
MSCSDCSGHGILDGNLPGAGNHEGPWRWCRCHHARERMEREPNLVRESNQSREKLIAAFAGRPAGKKPPTQIRKIDGSIIGQDEYRGDF